MKTALILVALGVLLASSVEGGVIDAHESKIIVEKLLKLRSPSASNREQLKEYRDWESLYVEFKEAVKGNPTEEQIKIYLLLVFIAEENYMAHTTEDISKSFLPIFRKNAEKMFAVLESRRFLVMNVCRSIAGYRDFDRSDENRRKEIDQFMASYGERLERLKIPKGNACLGR